MWATLGYCRKTYDHKTTSYNIIYEEEENVFVAVKKFCIVQSFNNETMPGFLAV